MDHSIDIKFLSDYDSFINYLNDVQTKCEIDHYLKEKVLLETLTFGILDWWKTTEIK